MTTSPHDPPTVGTFLREHGSNARSFEEATPASLHELAMRCEPVDDVTVTLPRYAMRGLAQLVGARHNDTMGRPGIFDRVESVVLGIYQAVHAAAVGPSASMVRQIVDEAAVARRRAEGPYRSPGIAEAWAAGEAFALAYAHEYTDRDEWTAERYEEAETALERAWWEARKATDDELGVTIGFVTEGDVDGHTASAALLNRLGDALEGSIEAEGGGTIDVVRIDARRREDPALQYIEVELKPVDVDTAAPHPSSACTEGCGDPADVDAPRIAVEEGDARHVTINVVHDGGLNADDLADAIVRRLRDVNKLAP